MSFETTRDPDRFRHLERLFELLLSTDPSRWDEVADRAIDLRLAAEAQGLLLLDRSGEPDRYLRHLVSAARAVLQADPGHPHDDDLTDPPKSD